MAERLDGIAEDDDLEPGSTHEHDPWMTIAAAAEDLGIAPPTVKTLALKKELDSQITAGRIVIGRESVRQYKRARPDRYP